MFHMFGCNRNYILSLSFVLISTIMIIILINFYSLGNKFPRKGRVELIKTAEYVRNNFAIDFRFAMGDPGIFRYISQRKTIALNGLIGDMELAGLVKMEKYKEIVKKYGIDYFVLERDIDEYKNLKLNPVYSSEIFVTNYGEKYKYEIFKADEFFDQ